MVARAKPLRRPLGAGPFVERGDLARRLGDDDPAVVEDGDARGVVAAVFQTAQAVDEHAGRVRFSDVSDDSAHDDMKVDQFEVSGANVPLDDFAGAGGGSGPEFAARIDGGVDAGVDAVADDGAELAAAGVDQLAATSERWFLPSWRRLETVVPAPKLTFSPSTESPT
jgi:hypothetical protein